MTTSESQMPVVQSPTLARAVLNLMPRFQAWRVFSWIGDLVVFDLDEDGVHEDDRKEDDDLTDE